MFQSANSSIQDTSHLSRPSTFPTSDNDAVVDSLIENASSSMDSECPSEEFESPMYPLPKVISLAYKKKTIKRQGGTFGPKFYTDK